MTFTPDYFDDDPMGRTFLSGNGVAGGSDTFPNVGFRFHFSVLPGDYNQNGKVELADYTAWEDTFQGLADWPADGDGDGIVTLADQDVIDSYFDEQLSLRDRLVPYTDRGDYNDDEIVDGLDYAVWKAAYGNTAAQSGYFPDGSGNNVVDVYDYGPWRNNLDDYSAWYTGPPPGSGGGGIPIVQIGEAPRVANVTISGSMSAHAPYSFDAHDGSGEQLRTVPVGAADTVEITFSEDVNISAGTLQLIGMWTANRPTLAEFSYDVGTMTASWRFNGWVVGDQYAIWLSDAVTDVEGNPLDGEWNNPTSLFTTNAAVSEFPSGDGYAGGDFVFVATLLPGDANLDLVVNQLDLDIFIPNLFQGLTNALFTDGDFNGSGTVNFQDIFLIGAHSGMDLQNLWVLGDLNGDWIVDELDSDILVDNLEVQNPTQAQGDLDEDGDIDLADLDMVFAQWGLALTVVS